MFKANFTQTGSSQTQTNNFFGEKRTIAKKGLIAQGLDKFNILFNPTKSSQERAKNGHNDNNSSTPWNNKHVNWAGQEKESIFTNIFKDTREFIGNTLNGVVDITTNTIKFPFKVAYNFAALPFFAARYAADALRFIPRVQLIAADMAAAGVGRPSAWINDAEKKSVSKIDSISNNVKGKINKVLKIK